MNPLFQSLYSAVVVNTNRPNLRKETINAIKTATLELHGRGKFRADVKSSVLTSTNGGTTSYQFTVPRDRLVRELLAVAPVDSLGREGIPLRKLDLFEQENCGSWFKWSAGILKIRTAYPATTFSLSFLSFPNLDEANYDSWIAEKYPHFVIDAATYRVLLAQRILDQANIYKGLVGDVRVPGTHIFNLFQENEEIQ